MKKNILLIFLVVGFAQAQAGNKIKYYFNQPVDNSVSKGVNAVYLHNCIADTLTAYLNRAKYSLDICVYDFENTLSFNISTVDTVFAPEIAAAINNAHARGVKVRYIYEGGNANTGLTLLNPGIHTLGRNTSSGIMHNKFVVIDAGSSDPNDATVWTGCLNWYVEQFNWDYNNVVVLQDSALAHAYTAEFNMMWGDTGIAPNTAASKFGPDKTDLGRHMFSIEGNTVELYFSPSDGTDSHIQSTIATADSDLYFGIYTFTSSTDANLIMSKHNSGVYVAGIDDDYSNSYTPHAIFTSGLGANFKVYTETATSLFHNKFLIVDPSSACSDPMVLTGSHNWSTSANTINDENTLIIHNDTAANVFYQYFKACFNSLGGSLTARQGCPGLGIPGYIQPDGVNVYPNPTDGAVVISYRLASAEKVSVEVYNVLGHRVAALINDELLQPGQYTNTCLIEVPGLYLVRILAGGTNVTRRVVVNGK